MVSGITGLPRGQGEQGPGQHSQDSAERGPRIPGLERWGPWGGAADATRGTARVGDKVEGPVLASEEERGW